MHLYSRDATMELDFDMLGDMLTDKAREYGYISFTEHLIITDVDMLEKDDEQLIFNCEVFEMAKH